MTELNGLLTGLTSNPIVGRVGVVVITIIAVLIGIRMLQTVVSRSVKEMSARYRIRKFIGFLGYIVLVLILLAMFSERLGQLTVVFGVAGAGIAFALQEVIASVAGWIAISLGGFYRPGERVQVGGIKGDVIDIGVLRTTLMEIGDWVGGDIYNGRIVRVANSFVFKEPVYNYSGEFPFLWDEIKVPVRSGSDWRLAQQVIEKAVADNVAEFQDLASKQWDVLVRKFLIEEARVTPMVTLAVTDNWIEFTARYVVDYRRRRATKDAISRALLIGFEQHRDKLEFGSTTIEITAMPASGAKG
ncbi:mechanosensitive ion channel domain-containing protein [uncultured Brevundimonas sp.]|uniref:mechanosensitive ion channel family protein n=1 Tax=uncultured Brevundimonas sp. TaxID=213418 RepID=UPI0030ED0982|tara:strand:+ start:1142 stop:2044 length:903 start_codon:yes stop_codon:yes gene_type:complete